LEVPVITIDPEFQALIPPLRPEELAQLETNVLADGIRDPLVVWGEVLIDGHNRYGLAQKHGLTYQVVQRDFADRDAAVLWIVYNQLGRRNLLTAARAELAMRIEPILAQQAKARQVAGLRRGDEAPVVPNSEQRKVKDLNATKTATQAAEAAGLKRDTYHKAKTVLTSAPAPIVEAFKAGKISAHQAYQQVRREQKEAERGARRDDNARLIAEVPDTTALLNSGSVRFATIVIDPPWDWGDEGDVDQMGRARPTYSTMSLEQLLELPVNELSDVDAHLYLWITNRSLPKGFRLLEHWGFRYVTAITWVKPHFGMGNYFRGQTEHILFGVKGSQPLRRRDVGTVFTAPRGPDGHSSKPIEFLPLVESCSPGPYLEMFSRSHRDGWVTWGQHGIA
jgi:N6-adenosine-specific RNA methylase IME4